MALQTLTPLSEETVYEHRVIDLRRVARVVKGGRRFRFRAAVVVGDKKGKVGLGVAKGQDVQQAITKAQEAAKKHLREVPLKGKTIPHESKYSFSGVTVLLKPAPEGSGIIAGGPIRAVAFLAGIQNISSKVMGSRNKINIVKATLEALSSMKSPKPAAGGRKEANAS